MKRNILSIITALALCLGLLPAPARAAGSPTRTEALDLTQFSQATDMTLSEGWKWEPDANGGTLTLTDCHIQSEALPILKFPNTGSAEYTIILNGDNVLETSSTRYTPMIKWSSSYDGGSFTTRSGTGGGSLEFLLSNAKTDGSNNPYGFSALNLTFEDVTIKTNTDLCTINDSFTMRDCSLTIDGASTAYCGIYVNNGPIRITDSDIDIAASQGAIFVSSDSASALTERSIEISGGTAKLSAGVGSFYMYPKSFNGSILTNHVKLSNGAKVDCVKGLCYGANLSLEGEGTEMTLASSMGLLHPSANTVSIGRGAKLILDGSGSIQVPSAGSTATLTNEGDFIISAESWFGHVNSAPLTLSGSGGFYCATLSGETTIEDSVYTGADQRNSLDISSTGSAMIKDTEFLPLSAMGADSLTFERQSESGGWSAVTQVKDAGTYRASAQGSSPVTFTIAPKPISVSGVTVAASKPYDGSDEITVTDVTLDGVAGGDDASVSLAGLTATLPGSAVGTYPSVTLPNLTLSGTSAKNYALTQPTGTFSANVEIQQAEYTKAKSIDYPARYGSPKTVDLGKLLDITGDVAATLTSGDLSAYFSAGPEINGTKLTFTLKSQEEIAASGGGTDAAVSVFVSSQNYRDFNAVINIIFQEKDTPDLTVEDIACVYTGEPVSAGLIRGTATVDGEGSIDGGWTFDEDPPVNVNESGKFTVRFTPKEDSYNSTTCQINVTVTPAPRSSALTFSGGGAGMTLGDITVTLPEGWSMEHFSWVDGPDIALEQGKRYAYRYDDGNPNYQPLEAGAVLWTAPGPANPDGEEFKVVVQPGIGTVPPALADDPNLNSTEKLETAMRLAVTQAAGASSENTAVYDVTLLVSQDGGAHWTPATEENFPANGKLRVTLPYPAQTDSTYLFTVIHMFTTSAFGKIPGQTERPDVTNTAEGIQFDVTGLSPISVAWVKSTGPSGGPSSGSSGSSSGGSSGGGSPSAAYAVTVDRAEHGKVITSHTAAVSGATVTLTAAPHSGYTLDALTVTDSLGNAITLKNQGSGKFAFTMPSRAVRVKASFSSLSNTGADCPSQSFADLGGTDVWYHEAVDYVLEHGLMGGYSDGLFRPDHPLTRAQLAQILYNAAGRPATGGSGFTDVPEDMWCAAAVRWAASQGIVKGYGGGAFRPNAPITREQLAVMLWRSIGSPAATGKELRFADAGEAGDYALEALRWAVENGVVSGYANGQLRPKNPATRAHAAKMLANFLKRAE